MLRFITAQPSFPLRRTYTHIDTHAHSLLIISEYLPTPARIMTHIHFTSSFWVWQEIERKRGGRKKKKKNTITPLHLGVKLAGHLDFNINRYKSTCCFFFFFSFSMLSTDKRYIFTHTSSAYSRWAVQPFSPTVLQIAARWANLGQDTLPPDFTSAMLYWRPVLQMESRTTDYNIHKIRNHWYDQM